MKDKVKIIFFGASGYIGRKLTDKFNNESIIKTFNNHPIQGGFKINIQDENYKSFFDRFPNVHTIFILGGITNFSYIRENPSLAYEVNVKNMKNFIKEIASRKIKPIFFSSESVFDGIKGMYNELDIPKPIFEYGFFKREVENYIIKNFNNYIIFRLSKVFDSDYNNETLITSWLNKILIKDDITCADDNFFSPIHINDLLEIVIKIYNIKNTKGIYHISSNEHLNRKDMLLALINQIPKNFQIKSKIKFQSLHKFQNAESQPLNTTLDSSKIINQLNFTPSNLSYWIKDIINQKYYLDRFDNFSND